MSQQINLFNPVFLKQHKLFSLLTMLQGLGLILAGSMLFYAYARYQVAELDKQSEQSTRRFNAEQARLTGYSAEFSPQQANQRLQDELQQLEKKVAETHNLVEVLRSGAVGNTTGYSEYMRAFARQVVPGLWLTGFTVTGDAAQISLNGGVLDPKLVPVYIQKLGREDIMQGKSFATLQIRQPDVKDKVAAARYLEFTLLSAPDTEAKP